ncbi:MFS transporter [Nonomuraea africana]|uniref:MFS transporter n=1 Tax=Nonomuraea africana TaxID=46171 RepID=UPI0033D5261A
MNSNAVRDPRRWWSLVVLCLALMPLVVDSTVLNVAIPTLMQDLGASPSEVQWILDSYVLVFAGLLLTAGSLSDRYGRRRFLIIGLALFGGASMVAVLAVEPWQLIAARGLMGVGGAILMPSTLSILITTFDDDERRKAMAAWSAVAMIGVIAGPIVGGFLIEHYWWGSVFLLNAPIAAVGIIAALVLMPETKGPARSPDPLGVVLSVVGLASLVYVVIERTWNPVMIGLAVLSLGGFLMWERRSASPMLPLGLFRSRDFSGSSFSILLMSFGTGAVMLMLTQYLQFVLGYGAAQAGLALLPYAISAALFNGLGAALGQKVSNRTLIVSGILIMGLSFVVMALSSDYWTLLVAFLVMGAGGGIAGPAAYATLMGAVPMEHAGVGSALNDTIQQVGMALSIAALGSVLAGVYTSAMPSSAPAAARESIANAVRLTPEVAAAGREAFSTAMTTGAWIGAVSCVAAACLALAVLRPKTPAPQVPAEV